MISHVSRLVDLIIQKQVIIQTLPLPTTSGLKLWGFLYTPVCNARSELHRIAHVRQTIVPYIRFRNLGLSLPCILIPSKYLPYIQSPVKSVRDTTLNAKLNYIILYKP